MQIPTYHIDAFSTQLFKGNPATVCILPKWLPDETLQSIATENHLPATAYLVRENSQFQVRWFTPEYEIDLCGHGSLALAYVIFHHLEPTLQEAELHYPHGKFSIKRTGELFTLNFPAKNLEEISENELLTAGLGATPQKIFQHKSERCVAVFDTEDEVKHLKPNIDILKKMAYRGIIVTSPGKQFDFVSRTFYPQKAQYEDAITGSSHCLLIPYWANRLNKIKLHAYQISPRGGELFCELSADRVLISGRAVMYLQGNIVIV
ncbi:MAG: PhzF family phenazine biosynthesis protein [Gammaproteobacteria bacterium]|nr:PhzF family phenazine biosynthesis protein [Gammaproteobacteria bacterium]